MQNKQYLDNIERMFEVCRKLEDDNYSSSDLKIYEYCDGMLLRFTSAKTNKLIEISYNQNACWWGCRWCLFKDGNKYDSITECGYRTSQEVLEWLYNLEKIYKKKGGE